MKQIPLAITGALAAIFSSFALAEDAHYVDLRPTTFRATVTEIISPVVVELVTQRRGYKEVLILTLADIKPGNNAVGPCKRSGKRHYYQKSIQPKSSSEQSAALKHACKVLKSTIDNENVGVEITRWEHPMRGYLSAGKTIVNFDLVKSGEYRVDYVQSRTAHLVLLEKKARCERVGSWKHFLGNAIEEMKCQD